MCVSLVSRSARASLHRLRGGLSSLLLCVFFLFSNFDRHVFSSLFSPFCHSCACEGVSGTGGRFHDLPTFKSRCGSRSKSRCALATIACTVHDRLVLVTGARPVVRPAAARLHGDTARAQWHLLLHALAHGHDKFHRGRRPLERQAGAPRRGGPRQNLHAAQGSGRLRVRARVIIVASGPGLAGGVALASGFLNLRRPLLAARNASCWSFAHRAR